MNEVFLSTAGGTGGISPDVPVSDNSNLTDDAKITFTTPLSQYRSGAADSP